MKSVFDTSIFDIAPLILKKHEEMVIFMKVIDKLYQKYFVDQFKELILMDRLEELEEWKIDLLAEEFHVDFYPLESSIEEKVALVKGAIDMHMHKGTVGTIQGILDIYKLDAELIQWYETTPKDEPGTFRIVANAQNITSEDLQKAVKAINSMKRESQHLIGFTVASQWEGEMYHGITVHQAVLEEVPFPLESIAIINKFLGG